MMPFGMFGYSGIIIIAVISVFVAWQGDRASQRSKGAQTAVAKMESNANANAKKAETARRSVDKLPTDSLRDTYFRD